MSHGNDGTGVLGQYGPQRSKMDMMMQKQYGHPQNPGFHQTPSSSVGVLGQYGPQRSVMDEKMQSEFGGLNKENYTYDTGYRSVMDKMMEKKFNPYYREGYQTPGSIATLNSNPYNPALNSATWVPLS